MGVHNASSRVRVFLLLPQINILLDMLVISWILQLHVKMTRTFWIIPALALLRSDSIHFNSLLQQVITDAYLMCNSNPCNIFDGGAACTDDASSSMITMQ